MAALAGDKSAIRPTTGAAQVIVPPEILKTGAIVSMMTLALAVVVHPFAVVAVTV